MVVPEYTSCSLGCAGLLCAGNGFWGLLGAVLPGIMLWEGEIDVISTLFQDDKSNSKGFHRGNLAVEQPEVVNRTLEFSLWASI